MTRVSNQDKIADFLSTGVFVPSASVAYRQMSWIKNKSLNTALGVQIFVTLIAVLGIWFVREEVRAAISAMLGGMISVASSAAYVLVVSHHKGYAAGDVIRTALRAEAVKIILTIVFLWIAFRFYADIDAIALIGTFILVVLTYSMALLVSEEVKR